MVKSYSTSALLRKTQLSKIISKINEIRSGTASDLPNICPRPRMRWVLSKSNSSPSQAAESTGKFALRIRFLNSRQKDEVLPSLNKLFLVHKSTPQPATEVELYPSDNAEVGTIVLDELLRTSYDRRFGIKFGSLNGASSLRNIVGGPKKKMIVEFGSPNIAKPLHVGHLRSTVTGHYVARICKAAGHEVLTMCYLGDWGTQFGLLQAGLAKWLPGDSVKGTIDTTELDSLLQYYIRAVKEQETNQTFAREARQYSAALESQESSSLKIWTAIREKTLRHLQGVWEQLGISYDVIQGESEFASRSDQTAKVLEILKDIGLTEVIDGCTYANLPPEGRENRNLKIPIVKADGSSLYLLRDIAAAMSRQNSFGFDQMIYVVDKGQATHFTNLFSILSQMGFAADKIEDDNTSKSNRKLRHVSFGKVEGMSTRAGNFVLFSDVIRDGSLVMEESRLKSPNVRSTSDPTISKQLVLSSLITHFLRVRRNKDCHFDWNEALRSTGDTGVRLQYTHARLKSLEDRHDFKAAGVGENSENVELNFDVEYILNDPIALDLALHLINFEDAFAASYDELEPNQLLNYLFKLCDKTSKALKELKVLSESNVSVGNTRLLLFALARRTLTVGLDIIGIQPLDEF